MKDWENPVLDTDHVVYACLLAFCQASQMKDWESLALDTESTYTRLLSGDRYIDTWFFMSEMKDCETPAMYSAWSLY